MTNLFHKNKLLNYQIGKNYEKETNKIDSNLGVRSNENGIIRFL